MGTNEIEPSKGGLVDGVAFKKQQKEIKMGVDTAFGSPRIVVIKARHTGYWYIREQAIRDCKGGCFGCSAKGICWFYLYAPADEHPNKKHVDSKVVDPKQITSPKANPPR